MTTTASATLDLVFSVNAGAEETVELYRRSGAPRTEVSAGHTVYLEELMLEPGDVVAYYARARDENRVGSRQTVLSDMYFLQIRPFGQDFRQADAAGMPGAGGQAGAEASLSQRQREIIAATFNVVRDRDTYDDNEYRENVVTLALAQGRLQEQVERLARQIRSRGAVSADSSFLQIAELLPEAAAAMADAREKLDAGAAEDALPDEQRALQQLQRAEAIYREVQVSLQQQGGGGGGAGSAEDLADLFELELDKLQNQYETVQRSQQQQADDQLDETMERLKELARRQQQEVERQRRAAQNQRGGGGGAGQRQLAEETEETARQLERLARETSNPQLQETARQLREAAEAMRRSAARTGRNEGSAAADDALDRLDEARRLLDREQTNRLRNSVRNALERVERLAADQDEILDELESLPDPGLRRGDDEQRLMQRKDLMGAEVEALERQLDRMAADARRENPEAGRALQEAANAIRDDKLKEKLRFSKAVLQGRETEFAREFDETIAADLDHLRRELEEAVQATSQVAAGDRRQEALDRARDLVRGVESLRERMENAEETADRRPPTADGSRVEPGSRREGLRSGEAESGQGERAGAEPPSGEGQPPREGQRAGDQPPSGEEQRSGGEQPSGEQQPSEGQAAGAGQRSADQRASGGRFAPDGGAGGAPGRLSEEEARQFRSEIGQRRQDAEGLRNALNEQEIDAEELDAVIAAMRRLELARTYDDPEEVARLRKAIVEGLKSFEFRLRRELEGESVPLFLSSDDEVPEGFRELVEEYYRELAKRNSGGEEGRSR